MGRPSRSATAFAPGKRHINVVLSADEYVLVRECARALHLTMTEFIKKAIKEKVLLDGKFYMEVNGEMRQIGGIV